MPPQTFGEFRPASLATSTNTTGEAAGGAEMLGFGACGFVAAAASRSMERFHFHSGLVSASNRALPRTTEDEARKRRRSGFTAFALSRREIAAAKNWARSNPFLPDRLS